MGNLEKVKEIRQKLIRMNLIVDDGRETGDSDQNISFGFSIRELEGLRAELAKIEFENANALWNAAHEEYNNINLPEEKFANNHGL